MSEEVLTLTTVMRNLNDIRTEIESATERRTELWHTLSEEGHNAEVAAELEALSARIDELWIEHRQARPSPASVTIPPRKRHAENPVPGTGVRP